MGFIHYDLEFKKHIDVNTEFNKTIEDVVYYLKRKGNVGIRFKYYDEMMKYDSLLQSKISEHLPNVKELKITYRTGNVMNISISKEVANNE